MAYGFPVLLGFAATCVATTPPGLLNMTAAKIGVDEGRTRALVFASGAAVIVLLQSFIAVIFARYIDANPHIIILLREIGLAVFIALTIYFFIAANKVKVDKEVTLRSKRSRFFMGMLLSALNFFPIPFYVVISIALASYDYFVFENSFIYSFVFGCGLGAFFALFCYVTFFKKMEARMAFLLRNMNYIIGSVTGLIAILTVFNIFHYYYNAS